MGGITRGAARGARWRPTAGRAVRAALRQPIAGDRVHAAPDGRDRRTPGPYVEFSIEGPEYYPWQTGCFEPDAGGQGRRGADPAGPGLGRRDPPATGSPAPSTRPPRPERPGRSQIAILRSTTGVPSTASSASTRRRQPSRSEHGHGVQADRVGPVGRAGREHAGQRPAAIVAGIHQQGRAIGQMQPGQHHDPCTGLEAVQRFGVGRVDGQPGGRGALAGLAGGVGAVAQGRFDHADHQHPIVVAAEHGGTVLRAVISAPLLHRRWW